MAIPEMQTTKGGDVSFFNMGLATLERLHDIIKEIKKASVMIALGDDATEQINKATALNGKIALVRQFYINSFPLIPDKFTADLEKELDLLVVSIQEKFVAGSHSHKGYRINEYVYELELDKKTDMLQLKIMKILKDKGVFMPPSNDPRNAFKRD